MWPSHSVDVEVSDPLHMCYAYNPSYEAQEILALSMKDSALCAQHSSETRYHTLPSTS